MTPELLTEIGEALYGNQWQTDLARDLDVAVRTVQRWLSGERAIPAGLSDDLRPLLAARGKTIEALIHRL